MNTIKEIFKKELRRVLFDKKMLFSLYVLPVVVMIGIYGLMGVMMENMSKDIEKHTSNIVVYQAPDSFKEYIKKMDKDSKITFKDQDDFKADRKDILGGKIDLAVGFEDGFEQKITNYKKGDAIPQVKTYYNPTEDYSSSTYNKYTSTYIESYRNILLEQRTGDLESVQMFTVDTDNKDNIVQDNQKAGGKVLGMLLPYLVSILLFAGVMALGTDTITGEKERGTIATMLVAPVKRSHIVYGKLLALMVLSAISALFYGVAMIIAMPTMSKFMAQSGVKFTLSISQVVMLLGIIVSMVFLFVALISLTSVFAKTVKEASSYVMPAYMVVIVCGMMTMFMTGNTPMYSYFIPIYGSSVALRNVLTMDITWVQGLITMAMNLVFGGICAGIVTKAFKSERVMFNA